MSLIEKLRNNRWFTLVVISIGLFIILIDTTVVNVSIPKIIEDLNANLSDVEWIISGYALSFAALLITFGRLGDIYGRRLMFILGLIVFGVASLISGEAGNSTILIFARLAQGIGGAMISPSVLSLISSNFKGKDRAIAFGVFGSITGIAVAVGPILGGFATTYYSWRWVFRINIPICILGIILAFVFIQESKIGKKERLDISGMFLSTIGFFLLVFSLIEGQNYGWLTSKKPFLLGPLEWNFGVSIIVLTFILSIVVLTIFIIVEIYKTKKNLLPAINIDFFKLKTFRYGLVAVAVIALGEFSSLFTLPLFWQNVKGFTPLESGIATLPLAIAAFFAAPLSARLVNKLGTKWIITTGIFLEFFGLILLSNLDINSSVWSLSLPLILLGAGIGLAISQNTQVILSQIQPESSGSASGVLNTIRQVGSALGIAVIGAVLASQMTENVKYEMNKLPNISQNLKDEIILRTSDNAVSFQTDKMSFVTPPPFVQNDPQKLIEYNTQKANTSDNIKLGIKKAFTKSIGNSIKIGAVFLFIGGLLSLLIPNIKQFKEQIVKPDTEGNLV